MTVFENTHFPKVRMNYIEIQALEYTDLVPVTKRAAKAMRH